MPINATILRGRLATWLTDTGQLTTPGEPVFDENTGHVTTGPPVVHFAGPMLIYPQPAAEKQVNAAGTTYQVDRYNVLLPPAIDAASGYSLTVTACKLEPALVGQNFTIVDVELDSLAIATTAVAALVT